ncbi:MAG: CdaR family protein [Bacillota bacterium]|nr:CdaR family protein [Bacillota bacterium]
MEENKSNHVTDSHGNEAKTVKEKREHKRDLWTRVLCLLFAIVMWTYTAYVENPITTRTFTGINIQIIGQENLEKRNLTVLYGNDMKLSLKLSGSRNTLGKVSPSDIIATADVSNITSVGAQNVDIKVGGLSDLITVEEKKITNSRLVVDYLNSKKLNVNIDIVGTMGENRIESQKSVSPSQVTVTGPATLLKGITAWTEGVDISKLASSENVFKTGIVLKNTSGETVNTSLLSLNEVETTVTFKCLGKRIVPVKAPKLEGYSEGFNFKAESIDPAEITITGLVEVVDETNYIDLEPVDVSGMQTGKTVEVKLAIPDGIAAEVSTAKVKITAESTAKPAAQKATQEAAQEAATGETTAQTAQETETQTTTQKTEAQEKTEGE